MNGIVRKPESPVAKAARRAMAAVGRKEPIAKAGKQQY
jgi:hypothetical protein